MAAQDEGRLGLDKLNLADLKAWLEDNLALYDKVQLRNEVANIVQTIGGGVLGTAVGLEFEGTMLPVPHLLGDREAEALSNIGSQGWKVNQGTRFIATMDKTVTGFLQRWGVSSSSLGANNTIMNQLFSADGGTLLADTGGFVNLNTFVKTKGGSYPGNDIPVYCKLPFTSTVELQAGTTYFFVQTFHESMTNGQWRACVANVSSSLIVSGSNRQASLIKRNDADPTVNADKFRWGQSLQWVYTGGSDPTAPESGGVPSSTFSGTVDFANSPCGWLY